MKPTLTLLLAIGLAGCASYAPAPLTENPAVLVTPVASVLEARVSAIERPWLKPVGIDLAAPLSPDGIAALAVVNNPDLIALRARAGVADAQVFAAGLLPDPTFSIGADKVLSGPDTFLNIAGSLGLDINALRKRAVTRQQAAGQARQVRLDLAWAEWQTAGQARIQAVRITGLSRIVALARVTDAAAQVQLARSGRAAVRGDIAASDAEAARIAAYDAADRLRTAERDLLVAEQELARLLGLPPQTRLALADTPLPGLLPPAERLFTLAQARRSDLAALRAGYDSQEASVHLAVLQQFPSLNLTITGNRDSADNLLIGPAIDFTLPLWNHNRGGIAVERATREALKAEYEARLFQTRAEVSAAWEGIALASRQLDQARVGLPSLERQAAASEAAARRGDIARAAAETARQQLRDRQQAIAQLELAIREQIFALELLSGEPIGGWG
jgi:outer membrane protein TolC